MTGLLLYLLSLWRIDTADACQCWNIMMEKMHRIRVRAPTNLNTLCARTVSLFSLQIGLIQITNDLYKRYLSECVPFANTICFRNTKTYFSNISVKMLRFLSDHRVRFCENACILVTFRSKCQVICAVNCLLRYDAILHKRTKHVMDTLDFSLKELHKGQGYHFHTVY